MKASWHTLDTNADESMRTAADAAIALNDTMPNELFIVAEKSPVAAGTGRKPNQSAIKQFGSGSVAESRAMHNN